MAKSYTSITITAVENTWCHQRRRRRQQKRMEEENSTASTSKETTETATVTSSDNDINNDKSSDQNDTLKSIESDDNNQLETAGLVSENGLEFGKSDTDDCNHKENIIIDNENDQIVSKKRGHSAMDAIDEQDIPCKMLKSDSNDTGQSLQFKEDGESLLRVNGDGELLECINNETKSGENDEEKCGLKDDKEIEESNGIVDMNQSTGSLKEDEAENDGETSGREDNDSSPTNYILKCVLRLKRAGEDIAMEFEWLDGTNKELMHQVKTFLVNKLAEKAAKSVDD